MKGTARTPPRGRAMSKNSLMRAAEEGEETLLHEEVPGELEEVGVYEGFGRVG